MLRIQNIRVAVEHTLDKVEQKLCKKLNIRKEQVKEWKIHKKSVDARDKKNITFLYTIDVEVPHPEKYTNMKDVSVAKDTIYEGVKGTTRPNKRPVVVGSGPAGLFAALALAEASFNPIILERGKSVLERKKDVNLFFDRGILNEESNIQFGEGGAGTFSDGKLTTGIKDPRMGKVIQELVAAGAPEEIVYSAKPHVGTDLLVDILIRLRKKIESLGGEFRFSHKLKQLHCEGKQLTGLTIQGADGHEYQLEADQVILAVGHSARDTFEMLYENGVPLVQKSFAVGFRIEHNQTMINESQYGAFHQKLEAATYKLNTHTKNGRGVYTFCMCPGGYVVAAASEKNTVVTNGMSLYKRDGENANAGLLVGVSTADFGSTHPLAGVFYQRQLEEKAFVLGNRTYQAPAQLVGDFLHRRPSTALGEVCPTYRPGVVLTDMQELFAPDLIDALQEGILDMDRKLKGFNTYDAVLTGVESRSSSPVRITRNMALESEVAGLFPCGEGAGYAGGIMSAAVDGIKCAEAVVLKTTHITSAK